VKRPLHIKQLQFGFDSIFLFLLLIDLSNRVTVRVLNAGKIGGFIKQTKFFVGSNLERFYLLYVLTAAEPFIVTSNTVVLLS
jgi:hypothetical protein